MRIRLLMTVLCIATSIGRCGFGQPLGTADRGEPGDLMIQAYLMRTAAAIHNGYMKSTPSLETWQASRRRYHDEYMYMLGLSPLPERTPLKAKVTGTVKGDGFEVDNLHYQSRPGLYVTANLYRPAKKPDGRLPAILYVCGHSSRGRNGGKTAFQSHGIWFARHGYLCLIVDTLQLGEIAAIHHGTYREGRWWWHSRGYTSAGVECWNGVRGIDYLISRGDVDPKHIGVTGISGGGAATFWVAAADDRVRVAVPVSGMADLPSYVPNRVINGHCDCMFLHNSYGWPWTRIAALIAPRPMLFVNSDNDRIFPMDANDRVINRLERTYSLYGAGDRVDSVVSIGGHAYRKDIRQATYRFLNTHLKNDPREVTDSELSLVTGARNSRKHPIPPDQLRVFRTVADIPRDELNTTIDEHFVEMVRPTLPESSDQYDSWRASLIQSLKRHTFNYFPKRIPTATLIEKNKAGRQILRTERLATDGDRLPMRVGLRRLQAADGTAKRRLLWVKGQGVAKMPQWLSDAVRRDDEVYVLAPRGIDDTRWTKRNPPNYVERSHVLLGRTVDSGRVWDVAATARYLKNNGKLPVIVAGDGPSAVLSTYAALLEPSIDGVVANQPPPSHMSLKAPQFLSVLRTCDVPHALGMLAPRPLHLTGPSAALRKTVEAIYGAAGAGDKLTVK